MSDDEYPNLGEIRRLDQDDDKPTPENTRLLGSEFSAKRQKALLERQATNNQQVAAELRSCRNKSVFLMP